LNSRNIKQKAKKTIVVVDDLRVLAVIAGLTIAYILFTTNRAVFNKQEMQKNTLFSVILFR